MSTSALKFYKNTPILPNKNFMVDNIERYLYLNYEVVSGKYFSITDFQYIKHSLNLEIKIDSEQTNLEFLMGNGWNYMSIQNGSSSRIVYYFIINKEWRAQNTIKMTLYLDTINTFKYQVDYVLSDKTKVIREHKDRFENLKQNKEAVIVNGVFPQSQFTSFSYQAYSSGNEYGGGLIVQFSFDVSGYPTYIDTFTKDQLELFVEAWLLNGLIMYHPRIIFWDINSSGILFVKLMYEGLFDYNFPSDKSITINLYRKKYISNVNGFYARKVDYFNEGLNPILYKKEEQHLNQLDDFNCGWNLFYKGSETPECYLVPDDPTKTKATSLSTKIVKNYSDLTEGIYYLIQFGYNSGEFLTSGGLAGKSNISIKVNDKTYTPWGNATLGWDYQYFGFAFYRPSGANYLELRQISQEHNRFTGDWKLTNVLLTTNISGFEIPDVRYVAIYQGATLPTAFTPSNSSWDNYYSVSNYEVLGIEQKDFTDSTIIKVISIPYVPFNISWDNTDGVKITNTQVNFDTQELSFKVSNLYHEAFSAPIAARNENSEYLDNPIYYDLIIPKQSLLETEYGNTSYLPCTPLTKRNIFFESKLYHSSFYQYKFVYDSFSFVFQEEKIDTLKMHEWYKSIAPSTDSSIGRMTFNNEKAFVFEFSVTSTINSKFMFSFPFYTLSMPEEDYDKVLPIARNNELAVYNSAYITYLRTAYNYDLKAKERTEKLAGLQFGLSTGVGALKSLATTAINPVAGALSWGSTFSSTITGITQLTNTIAQAEDSVERKIASTKAQAVSVAGSDDVDLLKAYTTNKAKLVLYTASDRVRNMLYDLFFFTGYATGEMKVPDLTTRAWFNFIQADIVIKENKANIPQNLLDNISERFASGITNIHKRKYKHPNQTIINDYYNFDQDRENWEMWFINDLWDYIE